MFPGVASPESRFSSFGKGSVTSPAHPTPCGIIVLTVSRSLQPPQVGQHLVARNVKIQSQDMLGRSAFQPSLFAVQPQSGLTVLREVALPSSSSLPSCPLPSQTFTPGLVHPQATLLLPSGKALVERDSTQSVLSPVA